MTDSMRRLRCLTIVMLALFCALELRAQEKKLDEPVRIQMETSVARFMASGSIPGISIAVVEGGEYIWSEGFGMADLENFVPATPQTLYRLASISKSLTATTAMQLWERRKLDLDVPVQKYCPAFPQKPWAITTRQLLGHLGGIRHYKSDLQEDPEVGNTWHFEDPITAGLNFFANDPVVAKPGTKFSYSTQEFTLIGCVIEGASGEKYADVVRKNVLEASGMTRTQVDDRFAIIPQRTRFLSQKQVRGRGERRTSGFQLQNPRRRLAILCGRHGALRSYRFARCPATARDPGSYVDPTEIGRWFHIRICVGMGDRQRTGRT